MFFWFQQTGGEDAWREALSEHRQKVLEERRPAFVTVLDAHSSPNSEWDREEYAKMRYSGPLYFDFDAASVEDAIPQFHKFLANLVEMGVNLKCLRLYATGGRGFHIEVPPQIFMPKVPKTGVLALPYVYREMAMEMVVDTLDLRVYTGRRGRMWRTCGVQRDNGKYKVPLTLEQALAMDKALYDTLCSTPLPEPERELPELSTTLSSMFSKACSKTEEGLKRRAKGNVDLELLARFKGQFPPTLEMIMRGEHVAPGVGFQKLSMQLAITANALGKTSDQLVEACEGLCKTHSGDSSRYGSPRKRKEELRRMWEYTHENPCYSYSKGGIRSLLDVDTPSGDLDGMQQGAAVGTVAESDETEVEQTAEEKQESSSADQALMEGLMITRSGVHKKTGEGPKSLCNISFAKPSVLLEGTPDGAGHYAQLGLVADVRCDDVPCGRHTIADKAFMSRSSLTNYCSGFGGIFSGSDTQSGVVKLILNRHARKGKNMIYALHKEGLDVVQNPDTKDRVTRDIVWVTPDKVITKSTVAYTFQPAMAATALFNADMHRAEVIKDTADTRAWLRALMTINTPTTVAQMLGWFVSSFHKQMYHEAFNQFPLLHPNGPAGSGKSLTSLLLGRMNHLTGDPAMRSCGTVTTQFALKCALTGSCSIPLILDEYKPSEMGTVRTDFLMQSFRLAYNQGRGASGAMGNSSATSTFRDISEFTFSTPTVFIAESQEMQTAIVQRSLPVAFHTQDAKAHTESWETAVAGQKFMAHLGRLILKYSFLQTTETRREALTPIRDQLRKAFGPAVHDRQVYNLAIVLEGLNFLDGVLVSVFGDALKPEIEMLKKAVFDHKSEINVAAMSEAAKMFNDLSLMSRSEDADSEFALVEGREYIVKEGVMEVLMRETFVRYFAWCKRKGLQPYYSSAEAFMVAMGKFPATVDRKCDDSPLRTSGQARIFRFNLEKLASEGVEHFKAR